MKQFPQINKAYNNLFKPNELTIGLTIPIEHYPNTTVPSMQHHLGRVQFVEKLGFKAVWVRDVPFHVPEFGDAGQTYDPFTYLGFLAGQTQEIALCTGSIALPLHHPLHVAKSAATIDQLSNGRLILGVASGDRPSEYPAMGIDFEKRGATFREAFKYIRTAQEDFPNDQGNTFGNFNGQMDVLPKPFSSKIPMLITGHSRQTIDWIGEHADGWMYYPRNFYMQEHNIKEWRSAIPVAQNCDKPFMQPLYVDLQEDDDFKPQHIKLGFRIGVNYLNEYLFNIKELGVNHVALNLRFNTNNMEKTLEKIASQILPNFHNTKDNKPEL